MGRVTFAEALASFAEALAEATGAITAYAMPPRLCKCGRAISCPPPAHKRGPEWPRWHYRSHRYCDRCIESALDRWRNRRELEERDADYRDCLIGPSVPR